MLDKKQKERWKTIPGFPNYAASNTGLVKNIKRNKLLVPKINRYGYLQLALCNDAKVKYFTVHRIIMLTFKGASRLSVNHKDRNRTNNHLNNLEYMTIGDNIRHAVKYGKSREGENNNQAKLNVLSVKTIRELHAKGIRPKTLITTFQISSSQIQKIVSRRSWRNV